MADSPLLVAGFQKGVAKPRRAKRVKEGGKETKNFSTQVGELAGAHMPPPQIKAPTHRERERSMAKEEKLHATRLWVGGHMSTAKHSKVHSRANAVLKGKHMREGRRG